MTLTNNDASRLGFDLDLKQKCFSQFSCEVDIKSINFLRVRPLQSEYLSFSEVGKKKNFSIKDLLTTPSYK